MGLRLTRTVRVSCGSMVLWGCGVGPGALALDNCGTVGLWDCGTVGLSAVFHSEELRQQHRQQVSDLIAQLEQCHLRIEDLGQEKAQLTAELATQSPTGSKPSPGRHSPEGSPLQPKGKQQAVVDDEMLADFEDVKQQLEDEIQVKDEELDQLAQV